MLLQEKFKKSTKIILSKPLSSAIDLNIITQFCISRYRGKNHVDQKDDDEMLPSSHCLFFFYYHIFKAFCIIM